MTSPSPSRRKKIEPAMTSIEKLTIRVTKTSDGLTDGGATMSGQQVEGEKNES